MKVLIIIIAVVLLVLFAVAVIFKIKTKPLSDEHDLADSLDKQINKMVKKPPEHALVVGVYKKGRQYVRGYGVTSKGSGVLPDEKTTFQIGSITKVFTASLLQVLSDRGIVSLDSTLGELLGDEIRMNEQVARISLKQLATHSSGFPRIPKSILKKVAEIAGKENVMVDPYSHLGPEHMFSYLETAPDLKPPGKFSYSNYGVGMLGHVLEKVTGQSLEALLVNEIFAPLGMDNSRIKVTPDTQQIFAQGYDAKGNAAGLWNSKALGAAGAVNSDMTDMLKFVQASLDKGSEANLRFEKMRVPLYSGKTGLGWMQPGFIDKLFGNRHSVWHNGMVGGYSAYLSIDPVNESGIVILSARAVDVGMFGLMLNRQVRTQSWADKTIQ